MNIVSRFASLVALLSVSLSSHAAFSGDTVKVGLLLDMDSIYAMISGQGSVEAARLAIEDVGGEINGKPIELVFADHDNDVDKATGIARQWLYEDGVDVIAEFVGSPIALAVQELNKESQAVLIFNAVVTTAVTNEACAATGFHWMYDAYVYTRATGKLITSNGYKRWYTIAVDNGYGRNALKNLTVAVEENGGEMLGHEFHPLNTPRLISYLLDADKSGANVIALGNAGADMVNGIKQAFDLRSVSGGETKLTAIGMAITAVHKVGLGITQGMLLPSAYYWDYDERSRAWAERFYARAGRMPSESQAGIYSSLMHYFAAVAATDSDHGPTVAERMRATPVDDPVVRNGVIRADGRLVHDMYLVQVKRPHESEREWDYFKVLDTIPGEEVFQPLTESRCPLVAK